MTSDLSREFTRWGREMIAVRSSASVRFVIPVVLVVSAWSLAASLPESPHRSLYAGYLAAVVLSLLVAGRTAAVIALLLSVASIAYFFLPPIYSFRMGRNDFINLAVFTTLAVVTMGADAARSKAERRVATTARERDQAVQRLEDLRGPVPHCVECRKPIDDAASWAEIESQLATLVHRRCLCPDCTETIYRNSLGTFH